MNRKKYTLAFINSHPVQYFAPLYKYLAQHTDIRPVVFYGSDASVRGAVDPGYGREVRWDLDLLDGYDYEFVGCEGSVKTRRGFWSIVAPSLPLHLRKYQLDGLVIHGYGLAMYIIALIYALLFKVPVFMRAETHDGLPTTQGVKVTNLLKRALFRFFDGFLAIGSRNRQYYESMGVRPDAIFNAPYTVDHFRFASESEKYRIDRNRLRELFGFNEEIPILIYVGRLIRIKRVDLILGAVSDLQGRGVKVGLLIVGDGEDRCSLEKMALNLKISNVRFAGFSNQSELPKLYATADILVLPSDVEPWGLVVNEAMACGLPCVVSDSVGAGFDLVAPQRAGAIFARGDQLSLVDALAPLLTNPARLSQASTAAKCVINEWTYFHTAMGFSSALAASIKLK